MSYFSVGVNSFGNKDLIYETDDENEITPILSLLKKRPKAYFEAEVIKGRLQIGNEVKEQKW